MRRIFAYAVGFVFFTDWVQSGLDGVSAPVIKCQKTPDYQSKPVSDFNEEEPSFFQYLPEKTTAKAPNGGNAWCDLYYQFSWRITDKETLTIGERDRSISDMINGIQAFGNETDFEQMIKLSKEDVTGKLMEIAEEYSSGKIRFTIRNDSVSFEKWTSAA